VSGIAGIFYRDGRPVQTVDLENMRARLAHRGADGSGAWQSGPVGLVHRLFCARDAMGVKPFFYFDSREVFALASEIKALFCLPQLPRAPSEAQIAGYLTFRVADPALSFYAAVRRLLPGRCLTVTAGELSLRRYWSADLNRELRLASDDEYAEAFREILTEAVRCRLRSAYPLAAMLSGGLDSSSVTCIVRRLLAGQPLQTISIIFNEAPEADEREFMREVVSPSDPTHHAIAGDGVSPFTGAERVLWHMEEPFRNLGLYFQWLA
jgi:asparagine synthase (glutamine-hydrolysing)